MLLELERFASASRWIDSLALISNQKGVSFSAIAYKEYKYHWEEDTLNVTCTSDYTTRAISMSLVYKLHGWLYIWCLIVCLGEWKRDSNGEKWRVSFLFLVNLSGAYHHSTPFSFISLALNRPSVPVIQFKYSHCD